jgi:2-iminobutanoate/2-iminopropanoate deaminase
MSEARRVVNSDGAARPDLPLSHAVAHAGVLYVGGQAGLDPATRQPVDTSFGAQFIQAMTNLRAVAEAGGTAIEQTLKLTVYVDDLEHYAELNHLYAQFFADDPPARKVICCPLLPGLRVEVDALIAIPDA